MNKPKRKYTLTEKALAANRRNLILAREVDPEIRYRVTPKRLAACHANLTRALAVLRAASLTPDGYPQKKQKLKIGNSRLEIGNLKLENGQSAIDQRKSPIGNPQSTIGNRQWPDSPSYGSSYTRGLYAVSLRRSARLAGESSAAFDTHVDLFLQALAPRNRQEQRLARGIAATVWRRLRVFRGQARWEEASLIYRLREAARGPSPEASADQPLTPQSLAASLACEIDRIFSTDVGLFDAAEKLNMRLERLSRLWVVGRGGDPRLFEFIAPGRVRDGLLAERLPASMGNPFLAPCQVAASLNPRDARELRPFPLNDGPRDAPWPPMRTTFLEDSQGNSIRYGMMLALSRRASGQEARDATGDAGEFICGCRNIETHEALQLLLDQAWEGIMHSWHTVSSVTVTGYAPQQNDGGGAETTTRESKVESKQSTFVAGQSSIGNPDSLVPVPYSRVLWSRLQLYAGLAERETAEVQLLLATKISGQMRDELEARLGKIPGGAALRSGQGGETAALLMELILLFNRPNMKTHDEGVESDSVGDALYQFLVERLGPSAHFNLLKQSFVDAAFRTQNERRREVLKERLAKDEEYEKQSLPARETDMENLVRARRHLRDVTELINLDRLEENEDIADLIHHPVEWDAATLPGQIPDLEWMPRYHAAASCRMLRLRGWKFESRARCRARVGLGRKKVKVKGLRLK